MLGIFLLILFTVSLHNWFYFEYWYEGKEINQVFSVRNIKENYVWLQNALGQKISIYRSNLPENIALYSQIRIQGQLFKIAKMNEYFQSNNLFYTVKISQLQMLDSWINIREKFFNYYLNQQQGYQTLIIPLVFGHSVESKNVVIQQLSQLGIIHLIVVSGLHFGTIYLFINMIFRRFKQKWLILIIAISIYFWFVKDSVSVYKIYLFILIKEICQKFFSNRYNPYKNLLAISLLYLLFNPLSVLSIGYWISYVLTFGLLLYNVQKQKWNNTSKLQKFLGYLKIYFYSWILASCIVIVFNQKLNLLSLLLTTILTPIFQILLITFFLFFPFWFIVVPISNLTIDFLNLFRNFILLININGKWYWYSFLVFDYFFILKLSLLNKKCIIKTWY
ncbi:ComEC/Rec2 family competence protein [Mycoplasma seminis]|uniref:ComEC/Rec2 family competence protein n=1 Tax=Mycoplasma seminis TaxID=512749 RepID=A0ABY9HDJ7_9MOLU|nr:ComEC/Rec2 family competence protein [Mycoplasma seminis]WLP85758.1 ComEC/Rec2 family competence protein [Mycoplasma seminis]